LRFGEIICDTCCKHGKDEVIGSIPIEGSNISPFRILTGLFTVDISGEIRKVIAAY